MLNQNYYGRMREVPPTDNGGPVLVNCAKCNGQFTLEKEHKEVYIFSAFFARTKEGALTPATPKPLGLHRLCPGCWVALESWLNIKK